MELDKGQEVFLLQFCLEGIDEDFVCGTTAATDSELDIGKFWIFFQEDKGIHKNVEALFAAHTSEESDSSRGRKCGWNKALRLDSIGYDVQL